MPSPTTGQEVGEGHNQDQEVQHQAASAIARIPPSSQHMFGGDDNQLSKVVELCKDLFATAERPYNQRTPKGSD